MYLRTGKSEEADDLEFTLSCIEHSAAYKREFDELDREIMESYMVDPYNERYSSGPYRKIGRTTGIQAFKDPSTNIAIETMLSKAVLGTVGEDGFVHARPVGRQSTYASAVANGLVERPFRRSGNYRANYVTLKNAYIFGAAEMYPIWRYEEQKRRVRTVSVDRLTGMEETAFEEAVIPIEDDIELISIDRDDYFGDPGADTIKRGSFAARRGEISRWEAEELAEGTAADGKPRWDPDAVQRAVDKGRSKAKTSSWREGLDRLSTQHPHPAYQSMVFYENWAYVPWMPKDGCRLRRITVLNGELVESRPTPLNMTRCFPFFDFVVNPIQGQYRGVSPGKVARYTQSFLDALLICTGEAVIRSTIPRMIVKKFGGVDLEALRDWRTNVFVRADQTDSVVPLPYNAPLEAAFRMLQEARGDVQGATGAVPSLQGLGMGTKRMTASEAGFIGQKAMDRPEMIASMFEYESYPALGQGIFQMYQQFLQSPEDLGRRIGAENLERAPSLTDIAGDFDIKFVGSRRMQSKEAKAQFIERAWAVIGAIPGAAPLFPWSESMIEWCNATGLDRIEAMVANPNGVEDFITRQVVQQQMRGAATSGNGNSATTSLPPAGAPAAQMAGAALA